MSAVDDAGLSNNFCKASWALRTVASLETGLVASMASAAASRAAVWFCLAVSWAAAKSSMAFWISAVKAVDESAAAAACISCRFLIAAITSGSVA